MHEITGTIFDIKEFAVFDGPGIRTTVFMKGCPLRCQWCHNPEGLSEQPQLMVSKAACIHCGACEKVCPSKEHCIVCGRCVSACRGNYRKIVGRLFTVQALVDRLAKDKDVFELSGGGVTFSGGEPLMQWEFVQATIEQLSGIHIALETSGFSSDEVFASAMKHCNLILMDWKLSDPQKHLIYTCASQEPIRRHVEMLTKGNTPFILRMPIIPGINDNRAHFEEAARMVAHAHTLLGIEMLPYQATAGAKYEMVNMYYAAPCDETQEIHFFTEPMDDLGIPWKILR